MTLGLLGILLFGASFDPLCGQTAKEVLDKMIEAQGGRKALQAVQDTTISGSMEMIQYGMNGSITLYQKEPDKMRMDIEIMGMVITQAFDGEKGWMVNPQTGNQEEMSEKMSQDFKRQALGNDSLLNPEKYGITYVFKGKEKIQDTEYLVLEQTFKDGQTATMYIDPVSYLTYKTRAKTTDQMGAEVEGETILSDYRKVGDLTVFHAMTMFQNGAEFMKMTVTKIVFNSGLEDALFKMSK
jgi:outer membrane lipoprotein-sorting protein